MNSIPIIPKENPANIAIMQGRWQLQKTKNGDQYLIKKYLFRTILQRNKFIKQCLSYELNVKHYAYINVLKDSVEVKLTTENLNAVTELDKEYANYIDSVYKDVTYTYEF